jgi:1-acyl-sn-glycerol-3-phosphate acyltransferase
MLWGLRVICGIRVKVSGLERVGDSAALIASRHQSAFDTIVWLTLVPRCCYVMKRELLAVPLFGPLMPLAGMIAVDRHGGAGALRALLRDGERAAREGQQIVIFPEGTRADPAAMLPLQPGVAALAVRTHLPVIPVATDSGRFWGRRAFHKRAGTIQIRLLEPIPAGIGRAQLMQRLEAALRSDVVENSVGAVAGQLGCEAKWSE